MIQYFIPSSYSDNARRLFAIIDDRYYWLIEWLEQPEASNLIQNVNAGFLSEAVRNECLSLAPVDPAALRVTFNGFAGYIERADNGFKSYMLWISPDPAFGDVSWEFTQH